MTTATMPNSKPRKQLSEQIDRLDTILDGLGAALDQTIGDAAREGTRLALKDAVVEILTDPTLRAKLHQATAPEPPAATATVEKRPGFWQRLKAGAGAALQAAGKTAARLASQAVTQAKHITRAAAKGVQALHQLGSVKRLLMLGVGVGLSVALASYIAPHAVAAGLTGLSSAVATAAVQVSLWTRRTMRALGVA